uniref:HMG box domain-containing protein n=1 Tax=Phasianus colchicus TaxID=9054 RepID=A0A669PS39_PHACC
MARPPRRLVFYLCITKKKGRNSVKPAADTVSSERQRTMAGKHQKKAEGRVRKREMEHDSLQGVRPTQRKRTNNLRTPKKPLPAFFLFMEEHRPYMQRMNPHWTAAKTAMKLGEKWHSQPEGELTAGKNEQKFGNEVCNGPRC